MTSDPRASDDIGVQLHTVSAEMTEDLDGTLATLADIGYRTVECASFSAQLDPAVLRAALDRVGMRCVSVHLPLPIILGDTPGAIAETQALGARYAVVSAPWVEDDSRFRDTIDQHASLDQAFDALMHGLDEADWRWNAAQLNRAGQVFAEAGLQLAYHNHGFEFRDIGGGTAFDLLVEETDPDLVALEFDCGWLANARQDPCEMIRRHAGRVQLLHLKDLKHPAAGGTALELDGIHCGGGIINWADVLRAADAAGVAHCFVEQEKPFPAPPLDELRDSYRHLAGVSATL